MFLKNFLETHYGKISIRFFFSPDRAGFLSSEKSRRKDLAALSRRNFPDYVLEIFLETNRRQPQANLLECCPPCKRS